MPLRALFLVVLVALAACAGPRATAPAPPTTTPPQAPAKLSGEINVFAAASLTEAFKEIGQNFEKENPGTKVNFNFAGSQQLVQQMTQGAPVDVFASAAARNMSDALQAGEVVSGAPRPFARNRLVVVYPKDNPRGVKDLKDLAQSGLKLVLAAKEVPVGQYALDFLDKAAKDSAFGPDYQDAVLKNVVSYEENVRAVLGKVLLGEVDAGIVYSTDVNADAVGKTARLDIPDALNTIASYPIAPTQRARNPELAQRFVAYVLSSEAQTLLGRYGFIPPAEGQ